MQGGVQKSQGCPASIRLCSKYNTLGRNFAKNPMLHCDSRWTEYLSVNLSVTKSISDNIQYLVSRRTERVIDTMLWHIGQIITSLDIKQQQALVNNEFSPLFGLQLKLINQTINQQTRYPKTLLLYKIFKNYEYARTQTKLGLNQGGPKIVLTSLTSSTINTPGLVYREQMQR